MLITIAHQCCHSCKQAYLHSNASLRPALTEYRLIIMNHKWKQTMLLSPQNNYQLQLEIQFKQHAFELYVLYLHREKGKKQIQMEQGLPRWPCALGTTSCGTPGQPGLSARASSFRNTTNKEIRVEIVHGPHQSKSQSRNPTSRNRWSERSFSWPPSPG